MTKHHCANDVCRNCDIKRTDPGCCGAALRAECCNPSNPARLARCLGGEVGQGGRSLGPAGTAAGLCGPVAQRSGRGMLYHHPSAPHRRPKTWAQCTNTDRSPSAAREDGNRTQETPGEEQERRESMELRQLRCDLFISLLVKWPLPNLLLECSHSHVGEHFHCDTTGWWHILHHYS